MPDFDLENFTHRLLAETLFYDQEYGILGSLSLVDIEDRKERFVASFMPEDGTILIEKATAWEEDVDLDEESDVAYALATESEDHGRYEVPEGAALELVALARQHDLLPSLALLIEEDE
jgi:hypothetical protein